MSNLTEHVIQIETRQRSFFGKIVKWAFIGFNIFMLIWLISGFGAVTQDMDAMNEAEKAGAAIGAGLGAMAVLFIWFLGDAILGLLVLLSRGKKVITTEKRA